MIYDTLIEVGLYLLIGISTLAFGGVTAGAIALQELLVAALTLVYGVKMLAAPSSSAAQAEQRLSLFRFPSPFTLTLSGVLLVFVFQMLPLPRALVQVLSPMSARIYAEAATVTHTALPAWLPLTVARQATIAEGLEFLAYVAIFFLTLHTFRNPRRLNRLVFVLFTLGFCETLYGLLRFVSKATSGSFAWAQGSFVNKNHFAGYLELIIPIALASLLIYFEKRRADSAQMLEEKYMKSLLVLFMAFLMMCAIILSGSRGGLISFSIGILVFTLLAVASRLMKRWLAVMLLILALALGIFMAANPKILQLQTTHFAQLDDSFRIRHEIWNSAWQIFRDFPLFGSGLGTYQHLSRRYKTFQSILFFEYAHNDYVQFLAETGVVGSLLAVGLAASLLIRIVHAWRDQASRQALALTAGGFSALVSIAAHSAVDFNLHIPSNIIVFCVMAAITYNAAQIRKQKPSGETSAPAAAEPSPKRIRRKKRTTPKTLLLRRYVRAAIFLGGACGYALYVLITFRAMLHYQAGQHAIPEKLATLDTVRHERIRDDLRQAVRSAPQQAVYAHGLGTYLYKMATTADPFAEPPLATGGLPEAERWLIQAARLDPANPQYYYSLGQLHYSWGDCYDWRIYHPGESWDACPVTAYFQAALRNAPTHPFYREAFGRWYAFYDVEQARQKLREILASDDPTAPADSGVVGLARLLYDLRMDAESDRILAQIRQTSPSARDDACQPNILSGRQEAAMLEIGSDDGMAEWGARLTSEAERVKKQFCLPPDISAYHHASLLVYASRGQNADVVLSAGINSTMQEIPGHALRQTPTWHEIPIDMSLFAGKSAIQVYFRTRGIWPAEEAVVIWGDADTPGHDSEYNFRGIKDLSADPGQQAGEYLIRLQLRR